MPHPPIVTALAQTARKRRMITPAITDRFADLAAAKGVASLADARRWLATGDGLGGDLAKRLAALLPTPTQVDYGAYRPLIHLADGGMGSVWLATKHDGDELVVVKTQRRNLPTNLDSSQANEILKRFEREARITQQLAHRNVVRCLDNGIASDGTLYMVLEYVDSGDLKDLVEARGGLAEGLALAIVYQVADGLAEAHRLHLIHRDIKPPNIFVSQDGNAKLADFGIARTTEQNRTMLTMEGAIIGSPLYMSPEQVLSDPTIDIRTDIYALGAVLYFALAGDAPYHGSLQEVLHKHRTAPVPDVRVVRPVVAPTSAGIVTRCMQKDRAHRYQDPAQLRDDLGEALKRLDLHRGNEEETRHGDLSGKHGAFRPNKPRTEIGIDSAGARAAAAAACEATMAVDLSGGGARQAGASDATATADLAPRVAGAPAIDAITVHTIARTLLQECQAHEDPTVNDPLPGGARADAEQATLRTTEERIDGDLAQALSGDWLTLASTAENDTSAVMLFARSRIVIGKLREAPVDLCVRNYPVAVHKEQCQRVSRNHLAIAVDALERRATVEDLRAPNGTAIDGVTLGIGASIQLEAGAESVAVLAGVVALRIRCLAATGAVRRDLVGAPASSGGDGPGIDAASPFDAVLVTRPENRPELAYAMLLRRLRIGGPGAELVLAGARTRAAVEVGRYAGRWIWRVAAEQPWRPLTATTTLDCGGRMLRPTLGAYDQF